MAQLFRHMPCRVRKSENFPDSKIFVAKTFRIKRVNCVNFQFCDKCAQKVGLQDFMHKHGPNMLSRSYRHSSRSSKLSLDHLDTFLNYPDTLRIVQKHSRSPWHISRSSGLFLDYPDTFLRLSGHCLDRTETFQIIHTLFRLFGHIF